MPRRARRLRRRAGAKRKSLVLPLCLRCARQQAARSKRGGGSENRGADQNRLFASRLSPDFRFASGFFDGLKWCRLGLKLAPPKSEKSIGAALPNIAAHSDSATVRNGGIRPPAGRHMTNL